MSMNTVPSTPSVPVVRGRAGAVRGPAPSAILPSRTRIGTPPAAVEHDQPELPWS